MRRPRGMTLIEMMVGLLIVTMMMTFIGTIYVGAMRLRSRTQQVSELTSTARAALDLVRRDLAGAFPRAAETYQDDPAGYTSGAEFHWDAYDGSGYRMLTFIAANDGSRQKFDPLRPYEYNVVSWFVRGKALYRQIGSLDIPIASATLPPLWSAEDTTPGLRAGRNIYDVPSPVISAGTYAGRPYVSTTTTDPAVGISLSFTQGPDPFPVTVTVCFPQPRVNPLPGWAAGFAPVEDAITADVGGTVVTYKPYALPCENGIVQLGPNDGDAADRMYFVIFEPLWFSLSEEVSSLVFVPPASGYPITNGTGPVPRYVDVRLDMSDPKHRSGRRRFGQRIGIPTGVVP